MSAPSFSSFPPSFASFPDVEPDKGASTSDGPSHRPKVKRKRNEEKSKDKYSGRDRKRHRHQGDNELARSIKKSDTLEEGDGATWRLFYSDRRGDMLNIQFGGLHVGHVPKYKLVDGGRSILGLSSPWTAYRSGKGIVVDVRGQRKLRELTDSGVRTLLLAEPKRLIASGDVYKYKEVDGFLPLPSSRVREDSEAYRSITKSKADSDSDSESGSESGNHESAEDEPTLTSHQEVIKSLEQQLSQSPASVGLWMSLLGQMLSTIPLLSKNASKARAEITLSVLSRAMTSDPTNAKSKALRIKFLKAGEEVWQEDKLQAEWEDALKVGGVEIWLEWLEWRIRRGRKGTDGVLEDALRAMEAFGSDLGGELAKLRAFWRVAVAFQRAGFTERATAFFQAQAELTFKAPRSLHNSTLESALDLLEEFWESEAPRIGESGAQGWAVWVSSGKKQGTVQASPLVPSIPTELDPYRQWAASELNVDGASPLPVRSTDELAETDPYSTVLFSDVRPLLFSLRTPEGKNAFRLALISFLGLPVPGLSKSLCQLSVGESEIGWDDRWCFTHLCRPSYLQAIFPDEHVLRHVEANSVAGALVGQERDYGCGFGPVKNWSYGVLGPLHAVTGRVTDRSKWKEIRRTMWEKEDIEGVHADLVRAIFTQLKVEGDDLEWDELALAFEAALGMKSALKLSRQFLSASQNSLHRWASHALLERMRGRLDEARKVYHTVLIVSAPENSGTAQLWWDWTEMEWLSGRREEALGVAMRSAGVEGKGGVAVLRAKRWLENAASNETRWNEREAWVKLRALVDLLTTGDTKPVLELFDSYLPEEGSRNHERMTVASLLVVFYHSLILQNPMPPALLRGRVRKAIELYPSNSIILGLFLEGEKGQGVWGLVRAVTGENGGKSKDVARRVEEVWLAGWEKGRWTNEIERTRSGLSAAIEHERTRASPVIWRIYIEFEIRANDLERAKSLLYRAIAECPLEKELYLLAFGPLRRVFNKQELGNIADTMAERGIRMRQGLDDVLEKWTMGRVAEEREEEENNERLDEIEENARELRRLMPY